MRQCRRPVTALLALVAFALSFGLPFMAPTHAWIDDPDAGWRGLPFIGVVTPHVETSTASSEEHCAICHWMRALGNSLVGVHAGRQAPAASRPYLIAASIVLMSAPAETGPARAPPTSLA